VKKARSFKKELIYSFLTIGFLSIVFLGCFQIYQLSSLIKESQNSQSQMTKYLSDLISNYVLEHKKVIQTEALDTKEWLEKGDLARIQDHLRTVKLTYPGFVNLYIGDKKGQSLVFYPEVYTDGEQRVNHNFSDRSYYKELVKTRTTVISPVFHGRGGTDMLLVTIVSPIINDEGEMMGYVLGALDLNKLSEHIKIRSSGEKASVVAIDNENNVVFSPEIDTRRELVNISDSPIVRAIHNHQSITGSRYFQLDEPDEEVFLTYEKISGLDWYVWVSKKKSVITDTYKNAIILIIVFLLLTAFVMVNISIYLSNRLEKSLLKLLNYIKDYTKDFKEKRTLLNKIKGPKEMEELYFHFNRMIDEVEKNRNGLIKLNKELEGRVQERTANLANKNLELKAVNKLITSVSSDKDLAHFIQHCLKEMKPFMDYSIHVFFQDIAVTSEAVHMKQNLLSYLSDHMTGAQQHLEPIQIDQNHKGFLIVDLTSEQSITANEQEFLNTFSGSMAIMLQNKFLFESIRNKHAVLSAVLESMSEGLMLVNNQKEVDYVNEFFLNVVSNQEEASLHNLDDVFRRFTELFDVEKEELAAFFSNEQGELKLEYRMQQKNPKYFMLNKFSVLLDEEIIGEGLLLRDITKEEEIDILKTNLISLTSHEFKTPITNIKGSVETLLRPDVDWEAEFQQELLEGVHEDIERIQHLVDDWMDISKIESGSMYVERDCIPADYVIHKSMDQIPAALRVNAYFRFHNHLGEDCLVYADKLRVQQVLVNLFTNGLRYNDSAVKEIDITLDREADFLTISVTDNGIGITHDQLDKIFNRFYQVDASATRRRGGTGLGLSICAGIMEAHEGKIEVKSELTKGSTFTLYFPIKEGTGYEKAKDLYRG
jgi:signal transduction histidine kinase